MDEWKEYESWIQWVDLILLTKRSHRRLFHRETNIILKFFSLGILIWWKIVLVYVRTNRILVDIA